MLVIEDRARFPGDVHWKNEKGEYSGYGFRSKEGSIYLKKCPSCHCENYAMSVSSGNCCWCGFDANAKLTS